MIVRVKRFDPAVDRRPRWRSYEVEARPMMSVLDALFWILEHDDPTLTFRYSCRAGMCGSCAVVINGREGLACGVRLEHLRRPVTVEPLRSLPVTRDLLVDLRPFFDKYRAVDPFYVGEPPSPPSGTRRRELHGCGPRVGPRNAPPSLLGGASEPAVIPPGERARAVVDRQIDCISCGACYSACPVVAIVPEFLGPAALNRAYAISADARDTAGLDRLRQMGLDGGAYACHSVGNCVTVCPVGVDPLLSIQLLRKGAVHR